MKKKPCASKTRRCIKRYSLTVNMRKWLTLLAITQSFGKEKDGFLLRFGGVGKMAASQDFRGQRNDLVSKEYKSKHGLQARGWKLALKDALETLNRYWAAQQGLWKKAIRRSKLADTHKTYLNQITASYEKLTNFLACDAPPNLGKISESDHKRCTRFLHKVLRRTIQKQPRVKIKRSFLAEPETYRVLEHKGRQYIALATLTPKKRLLLPLCGQGKISGQVRVVLDFAKRRAEIHHSVPLGVRAKADKPKIAIDLGITEVFTDSQGDRFGTDFGVTLQKISDQQMSQGQKRNRLLAVSQKACEKGDHAKARRIKKHNLGHKKNERKASKHRTRIAQIINQSLNCVLTTKNPCAIVYEDLSHMRGKARSKKLSRLVNYWTRAIVRERLDFKTSHRGSVLRLVHCAFSSQVCPTCGFVCHENRKGDHFACLFCGHQGASDHMAALELLRRDDDPAITLEMSKSQVHATLLRRFRRRLESGDFPATVTGKALGSFLTTRANCGRRVFPDKESPPECETRLRAYLSS